jgi:regulator of RNase E activity RraA
MRHRWPGSRCSPDLRHEAFPVLHGGISPLDSKGRGEMIARDVPVECAGVRAETGYWIFGDADGVVVVPKAVASAIFAEALRKVESEDRTGPELLGAGVLPKSITNTACCSVVDDEARSDRAHIVLIAAGQDKVARYACYLFQ